MSSFRIRPRFKHLVKEAQSDLENRIIHALKAANKSFEYDFRQGYINLKIHRQELHYWSPQLTLTFETTEEGTIVRGLYGPNPNVWTVFFFGYVSLAFLFVVAAMWGFARWNLGLSAEILWSLPVFAAFELGLYLIAQFGQKIGAEQMFRLHLFYEQVVHDKIHIS